MGASGRNDGTGRVWVVSCCWLKDAKDETVAEGEKEKFGALAIIKSSC